MDSLSRDRRAVVILSGGMDSATLLWDIKRSHDAVLALSFDYGQRHRIELKYAESLAIQAGAEWHLIRLDDLVAHLKGSSQTDPAIAVPHGHYTDESMKQTVVPNRNMIMLSIAAGFAIGHDCGKIAFAAHAGDHAIYPDCREHFVDLARRAIHSATEWTPVKLWAPYLDMTKGQIAKLGHELGVPFEFTWSCYEGNAELGPCGRCGTCVERAEALAVAGIPDPMLARRRFDEGHPR